MMNNNHNTNNTKIIQQNVLSWTMDRRNELTNYYYKEQPDLILLNSTCMRNEERIRIWGYNLY